MNPEDNNPLTNSGIPDLGMPTAPTDLTAPVSTDFSTVSGITGLGSDDTTTPPENPFAPVAEEPLVPAAPVPGSIGSVTSVPADVAPAPADPLAAPAPTSSDPLGTPAAAPAPAPYNPFAQPSVADGGQVATPASMPASPSPDLATPTPAPASATPSTDPLTAPAPTPSDPLGTPATNAPAPAPAPIPASAPTMAPPVQPTAAPKAQKATTSSPLTILLGAIAVVGVIAAIVFAVLYFRALKSPQIVYVPSTSVSEDDTNDTMQILTCTKPSDFNYLIGYDHEVIGNVSIVADYTNDKLSALEFDYSATFDSEGDANVARDNFVASFNTQGALAGTQSIEGSTMRSTYNLIEGLDLTDSVAQGLIYGEGAVDQDLSIDGVKTYYSTSGFNCSVE